MALTPIPRSAFEHYCRYDGNDDFLFHSRDKSAIASHKYWGEIEEIRQRLFLVLSQQATKRYEVQIYSELCIKMPDDSARADLLKLVEANVIAARESGYLDEVVLSNNSLEPPRAR